jgi:arylsulfatase A-like enzyme
MIVTCLVLALSCGSEDARLNLIVIAVDTLRPDHLGCYGYSPNTSPSIDALAAEGVLFENAVSQSPWTLPSFATVFTSLYPTQHGATELGKGMRSSFPTLAEVLKASGYATGAVINAPALKPEHRVNRGFDFYDTVPLGDRVADGTTDDVLGWIDGIHNQPFFMFAHYFDPHQPYSPPTPYDKLFDPGCESRIGDSFDLEGFSPVKTEMFKEMKTLTPEDWSRIISLYDGEIAFTDREIGRLLKGLEERGLRGQTLVVFLSDHGEEFYEHGGFGHGQSLYDELIKVPLVLSLPGVFPANVRVARQVRLLDVTPTILDVLGIEAQSGFEGVSLRALLEGKGTVSARDGVLLPPDVAYAEALLTGPEQKGIVRHPWKMVYHVASKQEHLYNREDDPEEQRNLTGDSTQEFAPLEQMLFTTMLGLSGTWYVELGAGRDSHRFDLEIEAERGPSPGRIHPYRIVESSGRIADVPDEIYDRVSESVLSVDGLELKGSLTLAFQVEPPEWPLRFEVQIDGRSAAGGTYLGEDLAGIEQNPFTVRRRRGTVISRGRPTGDLRPPYVLIWLAERDYGDDIKVEHDERTKRELRALGYIQ